MGRTGQWFAFQHSGIMPDVMTLAKALGNGVPIGACLAAGKASDVLQPGNHGSTFGGNPLMCAAAATVIDTIDNENLVENAQRMSEYLIDGFRGRLQGNETVKDIRAMGLMIGIELSTDCGELVAQALHRGLLINVTAGKVIRLLPPLIIDEAQADVIIDTVCTLIIDHAQKAAA